MTEPEDAYQTIGQLLALTRDEELDCEQFCEHIAAWMEGTVAPDLRALMEHHRRICPECEEQRVILARALGVELEPKSS